MLQFVRSSESMAPRSPKSAPDAPTDTVFGVEDSLKCKIDNKLPPKPESMYKNPILTAKVQEIRNQAKKTLERLNIRMHVQKVETQ